MAIYNSNSNQHSDGRDNEVSIEWKKAHPNNYLSINKHTLSELKREYKEAINEKKGVFIFQDKEILTNYAKYLIEYLETQYL